MGMIAVNEALFFASMAALRDCLEKSWFPQNDKFSFRLTRHFRVFY